MIKKTAPKNDGLIKEAKKNPGGYVSDIDWQYPENQEIPREAIRGSWKVDLDGKLTDHYYLNNNYRKIEEVEKILPKYMIEAARHFKNIWVAEISSDAEDLYPEIPEEKIIGWWYVDINGNITKKFRRNSRCD
jgi:hypothetical protein